MYSSQCINELLINDLQVHDIWSVFQTFVTQEFVDRQQVNIPGGGLSDCVIITAVTLLIVRVDTFDL